MYQDQLGLTDSVGQSNYMGEVRNFTIDQNLSHIEANQPYQEQQFVNGKRVKMSEKSDSLSFMINNSYNNQSDIMNQIQSQLKQPKDYDGHASAKFGPDTFRRESDKQTKNDSPYKGNKKITIIEEASENIVSSKKPYESKGFSTGNTKKT